MRDPQPWKRIGSLHLVEQLLGSVREPTRDAARAALLGLIADEDREVARRARQLWHERGLGEIPTARSPRPPRAAHPRPPGTSGLVVGIDFGTTNSAISVFEGEDVRLIPNAEGNLSTPSLVAIAADGRILTGTAAKRQAITNPQYTVRSAKLKLGTGWSITRGDVRLTAEDIARIVLTRLREDAEAYVGGPLHHAVLTVPANFDLAQRAALVEAGRTAGLNVIRVINEPTAAALTYGLNRESENTVLIFDLGGGTLDVSLIEVGQGVVEVKATGGDSRLGGDDRDERIVHHLVRQARERHGLNLANDVPALQRLKEAAEAAKVELSSASSTVIALPYLATTPGFTLHLEETLTRQEFEAMTRDLLDRCRKPVEQALRDAKIPMSDLDQVILTGGATRMPMIGELVSGLTGGKQPYRGLIPEGIVTGAALQSGVLNGSVRDTLLLDVTSSSRGFELHGGTMWKMTDRNTTIPSLSSTCLAPMSDRQTAMTLHVLEGEYETAADNRTLAVLELTGLARHPLYTPLVFVLYDIDVNGVLQVTAWELKGRTNVLPARARALEHSAGILAHGPEKERAELEATYFTGRKWSATVNRATMARAAALVASPHWPALRAQVPACWHFPPPPDPQVPAS
ncbi:Hsp70 family protein [Streptomyces sp. NPDC019531]|uniref:Hsp70 family protein n=1 Tax=Streptomyces sp. NPDC019531 TaxID=3365062 RepID=UPI00384C2016